MSREQITQWAKDAGGVAATYPHRPPLLLMSAEDLERFAALVAAHEREQCAKVCDEQHDRARTSTGAARADACAAAIRARGQT